MTNLFALWHYSQRLGKELMLRYYGTTGTVVVVVVVFRHYSLDALRVANPPSFG